MSFTFTLKEKWGRSPDVEESNGNPNFHPVIARISQQNPVLWGTISKKTLATGLTIIQAYIYALLIAFFGPVCVILGFIELAFALVYHLEFLPIISAHQSLLTVQNTFCSMLMMVRFLSSMEETAICTDIFGIRQFNSCGGYWFLIVTVLWNIFRIYISIKLYNFIFYGRLRKSVISGKYYLKIC